ncbi:MAG TPA: cell division protein BolA [Porticoccaceae bacterium]|jgi:acid stress-induced BolA-like protein IbaG/YrbA|nr:cell division protein BolA [Porticoccaceae bacterium]
MNPEDVKSILTSALTGCEVQVEMQGSHFNIVAVGDIFQSKRAVQRQQLVYAALTEQISSGVIHAVNMKLFTPSEWQDRTL